MTHPADNEGDLLENCYRTLGLETGAGPGDIKRAYETLTQDKEGRQISWERMKEISRAYDTIMEYLAGKEAKIHEEVTDTDKKPVTRMPDPGQAQAGFIRELLLSAEENTDPFPFWVRTVFFVAIALWGIRFIFAPIQGDYIGRSFMHLINLPFHEAGHILFSPFGDFIQTLGGTLLQILIPLICMFAFLKRRDVFGASFALWWAGQSFIDIAPYIYDARAGELMLLGGVTGGEAPDFHDWKVILGSLGWLQYDHFIAYLAKYTGALIIIVALLFGGFYLSRQHRSLRAR